MFSHGIVPLIIKNWSFFIPVVVFVLYLNFVWYWYCYTPVFQLRFKWHIFSPLLILYNFLLWNSYIFTEICNNTHKKCPGKSCAAFAQPPSLFTSYITMCTFILNFQSLLLLANTDRFCFFIQSDNFGHF